MLFVTRVLSLGRDSGSQSERRVTPRRVWRPNSEVPARDRVSCLLAASPQPRDSSTSTCLGSRHLKVWVHKVSSVFRLTYRAFNAQLLRYLTAYINRMGYTSSKDLGRRSLVGKYFDRSNHAVLFQRLFKETKVT